MITDIEPAILRELEALKSSRYEILRESESAYRFIGGGEEELFLLHPKAFMAAGTCGSFVMDRCDDNPGIDESLFLSGKDRFFLLGHTCGHTQRFSEEVAKSDVSDILKALPTGCLAGARQLARNCFASRYDAPRASLFMQRLKQVVPPSHAHLVRPGLGWELEPSYAKAMAMLRLIVKDREKILAGESIYSGGNAL